MAKSSIMEHPTCREHVASAMKNWLSGHGLNLNLN